MTRVRSVELRLVGLPLVRPFRTSFGEMTHKECVLVRVETEDAEGWGECVASTEPDFSEEWNEGVWLVLRDFLAPALLHAGDPSGSEIERALAFVRGHPMAKAALACGADGLLVEVHSDPPNALSDGRQSLFPEQFATMMRELRTIAAAIGKVM